VLFVCGTVVLSQSELCAFLSPSLRFIFGLYGFRFDHKSFELLFPLSRSVTPDFMVTALINTRRGTSRRRTYGVVGVDKYFATMPPTIIVEVSCIAEHDVANAKNLLKRLAMFSKLFRYKCNLSSILRRRASFFSFVNLTFVAFLLALWSQKRKERDRCCSN
jgi:hypothetical protein